MEDGGSPLIGLVIFLVLVILDGMLYGFSTAVDNISETLVEKRTEDGDRRAAWLQRMIDNPYPVIHILQIMSTFIGIVIGAYQSRLYVDLLLTGWLSEKVGQPWIPVACYVLVVLVVVFLLVSLGILAPQKLAARRAEAWAFRLVGPVHALVVLFTPFGFLAEKLSNLVLRICRMDPNENLDDVTEEEIISMVNEGHEQGVLQASEAEMIHNIFEFGDKEAKDIMTHRKNMVAVDGDMPLSEAMDYMLEKNNSRFPVYREDIDNIIGIVHIKDAMIKCQDDSLVTQPIWQIPSLVRTVSFIPETRNINSLFQSMQSQKNHMVIVVDEYGQTAGLVAMEDILEEIVGNILDEYDEEDTLILPQGDGSYLMKGMAPLDEVMKILELDCEMEDYDTLNGYLISLIDKIPSDHEVFEISDHGHLFQVLSVENKMIQTVRVTKLESPEDPSDTPEDVTCQDE